MVTLYCAVVGVAESAFTVDIDDKKSVSHLKDAIKVKKMFQFPANKLRLYLAKTTPGTWLDEDEAAALSLDVHGHLQGFTPMKSSLFLSNPKHFGSNFEPGEGQGHVLVVVPWLAVPGKRTQIDEWFVGGALSVQPKKRKVDEDEEAYASNNPKRYDHGDDRGLRYFRMLTFPPLTPGGALQDDCGKGLVHRDFYRIDAQGENVF
ncbi:hypothetical protein PRNP1_006097 [Phytophthora ramorum]